MQVNVVDQFADGETVCTVTTVSGQSLSGTLMFGEFHDTVELHVKPTSHPGVKVQFGGSKYFIDCEKIETIRISV